MRRSTFGGAGIVALFSISFAPSAHAVTFDITYGPTLTGMITFGDPSAIALTGSIAAAKSTWEAALSDPITVRYTVEVAPMAGSTLGYFDVNAPGVTGAFTYVGVKSALAADITSPADSIAVSSLQAGPALNMITNVTTATPSFRKHFIPGVSPGVDEFIFNSTLRLTRANQKALGLLAPHAGGAGADGTLYINSSVLTTFDFTQGDGITTGKTDATAIVEHEMGHGLGFISGVDHIDYAGEAGFTRSRSPLIGYGGDAFFDVKPDTIFTPLDLYRYSTSSITSPSQPTSGKALDLAFGAASGDPTSGPYFSVDAGATNLAFLSTGQYNGDGFQAQHWKSETLAPLFPSSSPLGLMDPSIKFGELGTLTALDKMAMDVIGYSLAPTIVPEPTTALLLLPAFALLLRRKPRS